MSPKIIWNGPPAFEQFLVPLDHIEQLPGNPRRGDVRSVAESLEEFGQRKPIVARIIEGDEYPDVRGAAEAGNHVRQAAELLGWTHVAAVFYDEDEDTGHRFALADNRTHDLGGDDLTDLAAMLGGLSSMQGTGWTGEDLTAMLAELNPPAVGSTTTSTTPAVPQSLWPVVRMLVEPTVHKLWMKMWIDLPGVTDTDKVTELLAYVEEHDGTNPD